MPTKHLMAGSTDRNFPQRGAVVFAPSPGLTMLDREFIDLQEALVGEYSLERELGRGGMGVVYLAREVQLDRLVAIKVLPAAFAARVDVRERFLREARMAASLSHPHIVPIYRVGEAKGFVFFVMAYVNGETLGERLRSRGPLSPAAAARMLREVAWALSYAHGRGIVHRDIKPDNILLEAETGRAVVSDFGIARGAEETHLSDPGQIMGTAHFMSPEQAASEALDGRSDLYSLGVVAFLALSGRLPFDAPSVPALMLKQISSEAPALATAEPSIPRSLSVVVDRLLRKNPAERFATGEALAEAVEAASAPARAKLPMALRMWAQAQDPLRWAYATWSGFFAITTYVVVVRGSTDVAEIIGLGLLPLVPTAIFHARKTFQALSAGYSLRDLRAALAAWQQEKRDEIAFEFEEPQSSWAKFLRGTTYTLLGVLAVGATIAIESRYAPRLIIGSLVGAAAISVAASSALGVRFLSKRIRSTMIGAVRSAIWNSRLGEWAAKLLTPERRKLVADIDYRPTEMALGVAVEELYAALPKEYRAHVPDLPAVAARLEAHAAAARARIEELDALVSLGSGADAGPEEVAAARESAKRELAESVTALESIRLDLLRLHGGASDLWSITTVLEAAREVGDELERLSRAQHEVNDIAIPIDLRPHTPV